MRRLDQRARLRLHQPAAVERDADRAPAHRRVLLPVVAIVLAQIRQRLVPADIDRAEHDGPVARGFQHVAVQPLLLLAHRHGRGNEELEFGAEQPDPVRAG